MFMSSFTKIVCVLFLFCLLFVIQTFCSAFLEAMACFLILTCRHDLSLGPQSMPTMLRWPLWGILPMIHHFWGATGVVHPYDPTFAFDSSTILIEPLSLWLCCMLFIIFKKCITTSIEKLQVAMHVLLVLSCLQACTFFRCPSSWMWRCIRILACPSGSKRRS